MPKTSLYIAISVIAAGLLLAACGGSSVPTAAAETTNAPAIETDGPVISPTPSTPTGAPDAATPTNLPTATPTALATPEPITVDIADRLQVIRESYSPEPNMKTFVLQISPDRTNSGCRRLSSRRKTVTAHTRTVLRLIDIDTGARSSTSSRWRP